jgi:hypothetical protein
MGKPVRLVGLPAGAVDADKQEIQFDLALERQTLSLKATYGVVSQVIAALGRMLLELQTVRDAGKNVAGGAGAQMHLYQIQKDRWTDSVIVQITTPSGVPYTFGIPTQIAAEIAEQLKIESAKPTLTKPT